MSLDEFSKATKARIKLLGSAETKARIKLLETSIASGPLSRELKAWTKSLEASYDTDIGNIANTKEALKNSASLRLIDKEGAFGSISKFRQKGGNTGNTIFVVTEQNLKTQFRYYNLPLPTVDKKQVSPGSGYFVDPSTDNVDTTKPMGIIVAYIIWVNTHTSSKKIEYYTEKTSTVSKIKALKDSANIIGIRQYGKSHSSTSKQMYAFLKFCGLSIAFEDYTRDWQIGHIESQSHGRLIITKDARNSDKYDNGLIDKLIDLNRYLDLASSSLQPEYTKLTADVLKSFKSNRIFMNVEMQIAGIGAKNKKDPLSNQGSGDLSRALNFVAILRDIGSDSEGKSEGQIREIRRNISGDIKNIKNKLNRLYKNYNKNKVTVANALSNFKNVPAGFLLNLESSDSVRTFIKKVIVSKINPKAKSIPNLSVNHKNVTVKSIDTSDSKKIEQEISQLSKNVKSSLQKLKSTSKTSSKKPPNGPRANLATEKTTSTNQTYSLTSLQSFINQHLQNVISANMGNGTEKRILNYRTGRFAGSAKVETMSQSRRGMITAFYSYMKNPYQTFEPGFKQGSPKTRDPRLRLLISQSIREIAATVVDNQLRSVSI